MPVKFLDRFALPLIWLAVCAVLILVSLEQIASGLGWGPDDKLRTLQIRDWLAGQSWFDTTQYRIGEPDSAPMHWPRWIELPLALFILTLTPLLGAPMAETIALVAVPLISLAIVMWLVVKITGQLFDRKTALLSAALAATAVPLIAQLRPMRIDHHGWQIALALLALWTLFWPDKRKAGLVLGAALALWLSISLEGLPLSVAFIILLVWRWAILLEKGEQLFWTLASFLGTSFGLYLGAHGAFDAAINYCDAISPVHLIACFAGGVIILPAIKMLPDSRIFRIAALGVAGIAVLGIFYWNTPQCLGGAFGTIDPLVRDYWYVNVKEGLPVWTQPWKDSVAFFGGSIIVGLVGLLLMLRRLPHDIDRQKFHILAYAFLWAFAVSLFVQRAGAVAAVFALPFMTWLVSEAFRKARNISSSIVRILATASVVFLILPGPLALSFYNGITGEGADNDEETAEAADAAEPCSSHQSIAQLNALPRANLAAPFNLGPEILLVTPHNVLATSHHRNDSAMADQIRVFTSSPEKAREIMTERNIDYVVACVKEGEMEVYMRREPGGLWAHLNPDNSMFQKPEWLQPVHLRDSGLLVWRIVKKDQKALRNGM